MCSFTWALALSLLYHSTFSAKASSLYARAEPQELLQSTHLTPGPSLDTAEDSTRSSLPVKHTYATIAGDYASQLCLYIGNNLSDLNKADVRLSSTFSRYYPEGSNPSLELLVDHYPIGIIDHTIRPQLANILESVGPDVDIKKDFGYGKSKSRAGGNGPLGGLPAFCRIGGLIATSDRTQTLFEAWLPLGSNSSMPLARVNTTDFPTNSTPIYLEADGKYVQAPLHLQDHLSDDDLSEDTNREPKYSIQGLTKRHILQSRQASHVLTGDEILGHNDTWNGRILAISNGGQGGFVPFPSLKSAMSRYRFAVLGSNGGHFSTSSNASWVVGPDREESIRDWIGGRSQVVMLTIGRQLVDLFYGPLSGIRTGRNNSIRSFVAGTSAGGAATLNTIASYPNSFDGAITGAPLVYNTALNYAQIQVQKVYRHQVALDGWLSRAIISGMVNDAVLADCDGLDGVKDGIVSNVDECNPDIRERLQCGGAKGETICLTKKQVENWERLYRPTLLEGQEVYPRFWAGIEQSADVLTGEAYKATEWLLLGMKGQGNVSESDKKEIWQHLITRQDLESWEKANIGASDVSNTDMKSFFDAGGKLLHFHGLADLRVSPLASRRFFQSVPPTPSYKYFEIPGMRHGRDGTGAWQIGAVTQNDAGNQPYKYDSEHDVILAMVAWVEKGLEPKMLVGAAYNARSVPSEGEDQVPTEYRSKEFGLRFTRLHCPFPDRAVWDGKGPTDGEEAHKSFRCEPINFRKNDAAPPEKPIKAWVVVAHTAIVLLVAYLLL